MPTNDNTIYVGAIHESPAKKYWHLHNGPFVNGPYKGTGDIGHCPIDRYHLGDTHAISYILEHYIFEE